MGDREIDQQLVERAQRGDKRAFELLVSKYQRKLGRLLSRFVRDAAEVEDVTQEAFIKAYRALPSFRGESAFYTWLYRIGINTAKNYLVALGRRAPTTTGFDNEEAEGFEDAEQLRDSSTPESELEGKEIAATVNRAMDALPADLRTAITLRENRRLELRGDCERDELPRRHGALADLPRARCESRRNCGRSWARKRSEMVMREQISRLMDGDLEGAEAEAAFRELKRVDGLEDGLLPRHRRRASPERRSRSPASPSVSPAASKPSPRCWPQARPTAKLPLAWAVAATMRGRGGRRRSPSTCSIVRLPRLSR
jgi:RNA polymerase sigma-70 factor (ECF subfamily)